MRRLRQSGSRAGRDSVVIAKLSNKVCAQASAAEPSANQDTTWQPGLVALTCGRLGPLGDLQRPVDEA